ncbi:hypothetical protein FA13DRAFT_1776774 [Coprinellus micaceus]|uniref:Uncharacterized protein n=1 Tax=Coprinellus micaceus TaxID=71717 RepID=A0A4Y7SYJ2_COPMI|nr:hypothetical protein FA13DRAFT_1776774 [Coprinellus micaceus]
MIIVSKEESQNRPPPTALDPGPAKRPPRRLSGCRCLLYTAFTFLGLLLGLYIAKFTVKTAGKATKPHPELYANTTLDRADWGKVVRPLVDQRTKFDIIATVWSKAPGERRGDEGLAGSAPEGEQVLYEGVVFKSVTLKDKHVHSTVDLEIPLDAFESDDVENFDLRATFRLIPHSPSLLDYATGYTSWRSPKILAARISPEVPGELINWEKLITDSFGITIPLIEFNTIKSACDSSVSDDPSRPEDEEDEDAAEDPFRWIGVVSAKGHSPRKYHPYVVTRTDLRVVKMTELYNLDAYSMRQFRLRRENILNGCIAFNKETVRDVRGCHRTFNERANAETKIELEFPDEKTGEKPKQYAYAPFLDVSPRAWGPLDLVAMPVNREHCTVSARVPTSPKTLRVKWKVAFSASSPGRLVLANVVGYMAKYNMTDTDFNKAKAQYTAQKLQRLHGHQFSKDSWAGLSAALVVIHGIINLVILGLTLLYWYTRTSTVGISFLRCGVLVLCNVAGFVLDMTPSLSQSDPSLIALALEILWNIGISGTVTWLILRAVLRLDFVDAFPFIRKTPASHDERASLRLEVRGRAMVLFTVLISIFALHVFGPLSYPIRHHIGPAPDPMSSQHDHFIALEKFLLSPLNMAGDIFQLILNYRSRTFAGQYKLAAWLMLVMYVLDFASETEWVVGKVLVGRPLEAAWVVYLIPLAVWVVQAVLYPKVAQDIDEKENE